MERKSSNSITHLVKTVAEEVAHDMYEDRITELETVDRPIMPSAEGCCHNIECALAKFSTTYTPDSRCGHSWTARESNTFQKEFETAIRWIARNHGRSVGAIRAKIKIEDLFPI